jgi:hypothetical protein
MRAFPIHTSFAIEIYGSRRWTAELVAAARTVHHLISAFLPRRRENLVVFHLRLRLQPTVCARAKPRRWWRCFVARVCAGTTVIAVGELPPGDRSWHPTCFRNRQSAVVKMQSWANAERRTRLG